MGRFETESFTTVHWLAIGLAAVSGAIHLLLAGIVPVLPLRASFLLAGLGFFAGVGLVLLGYRRPLVYLVGIPFTGGQIVLWYVVVGPMPATLEPLDVIDKVAQTTLVGLLAVLYARER